MSKPTKTVQKLTHEQKDVIHKKEFDPFNQAIISSDKEMRKTTSLQYQLLAAVFLGEFLNKKNGAKFEVQAIIDSVAHLHPSVIRDVYPEKYAQEQKDSSKNKSSKKPASHSGDHHFSDFPRVYATELLSCLHYLHHDLHGGIAQQISSHLVQWDGKLITEIKKISLISPKLSEADRNKKIIEIIKNDKFIQSIRQEIGLEKSNNLKTPKAPTTLAVSPVTIKFNTEITKPETEIETKKNSTPKEKPLNTEEIAKNTFFKAMAEEIHGNKEKAQRLYEKAESLGYSKKTEAAEIRTQLSPEDHIKNLSFANTYFFYFKNYPEKMDEYLKRAAANGNASAQYELGLQYYLAKNYQRAFEQFQLSVNQGYATAQYNLASMYFHDLIEFNPQEGARVNKLSANQGFAPAQHKLAIMHETGYLLEHDPQEALRLFRLAADQGYDLSQLKLALLSIEENNILEAEKFLKLAVDQENAEAQFILAKLYIEGDGIKKDLNEGMRLLKLASKQNHAQAQCVLGKIYENNQNIEQAIYFYKLAAEQNYILAYTSLGLIYDTDSTYKNISEAKKYYELAALQGDETSQINLGIIYNKEQNFEKALKFFELAAKENHKGAITDTKTLGLYLGEKYLNKDNEKAEKFLRISANFDCHQSQYLLGVLCGKKNQKIEAYNFIKSASDGEITLAQKYLAMFKKDAELEYRANFRKKVNAFSTLVEQEEEFRKQDSKDPESAANRKTQILKLYKECSSYINSKDSDLKLDPTKLKEDKAMLLKAAKLYPPANKSLSDPSSKPAPTQNNQLISEAVGRTNP